MQYHKISMCVCFADSQRDERMSRAFSGKRGHRSEPEVEYGDAGTVKQRTHTQKSSTQSPTQAQALSKHTLIEREGERERERKTERERE